MRRVKIGNRYVGENESVFLIAEAGVNHNGSLDMALHLVDAAYAAGADGIKFQLYRAKEQASRASPTAVYQKERTGAASMLEMAKSYDLPWEAHWTIEKYCLEKGISYMASCFDTQAVDFLIALGGTCIKVGSGEITNYPLLAHMAATGKPILLSTGMSTLADVAEAVDQIQSHEESPLVLLQCVSNYPAAPEMINLRAMQTMAQAFDVPVGFSDHTEDSIAAIAAVALGACMIEKHFTLDKALPGPDHAMSLNPAQLQRFIADIRITEAALGNGIKQPHPSELAMRTVARRSLVSKRLILAGEKLGDGDITLKRPANGIDPRLWEVVRGRTASVEIPEDVPITWEMLA